MIIAFIFTFFINSVRVVMDMLGVPVITTLPFGMDTAVSYIFGMAYGVWEVLWPIQPFLVALVAFLGYKVVMITLQAFFGDRITHG